jgi:N-hydroxyarylamine O-acetyltransferase
VRGEERSVTGDIDLDAYFARIGYSGARVPTLETLCALHALHPAAIAFENLDPLLGRRVRIDLDSIQQKLIASGRGGYCYEMNGLFARVLDTLGFSVSSLSARVIFGHPPEMIRRSHMLLKIELPEGPHIADVGFGGRTLSAPLPLDSSEEQTTAHGGFRLIRDGDFFDQQTRIDGEWQTLYRFSLEAQTPQDYEMANWYICTHPDSEFTVRLMAARLPPGRRLGLMNNQFSIHYSDGTSERRALQSAEEIAGVLETEFGIALPEPREALHAVLARMTARTA